MLPYINNGGFMNGEQLRLLSKMKKLVKEGKRRFQVRRDRDYLASLLEIGISEGEAWEYVLGLNKNFYVPDTKPNYSVTGEALIFKRLVNGTQAYIKLKVEQDNEGMDETVCLSFHKNAYGGIYEM